MLSFRIETLTNIIKYGSESSRELTRVFFIIIEEMHAFTGLNQDYVILARILNIVLCREPKWNTVKNSITFDSDIYICKALKV